MPVAKYRKTELSGKEVHYIEADLDAINVEDIGGTVLTSSTKFGINGTFFSSTGTVVGIATTAYGTEVRSDGERHANGYTRGTIVCYRPGNGATKAVSRYVINHVTGAAPSDWIEWAIGGLSLYINDSTITTETALTNKLVSDEHGQSVNGVSPPYDADRAAIGYKPGKIVLAIIKSAKPFTCRTIMQSLGCTDAVLLDGSTAAQMRAKTATGNIVTVGGDRSIYSVITVNSSTTWQ